MSKYRFEQIVFNSTEKKKPTEEDKYTYLGLEHLDSGSLHVTRYGSDVAPIGEKLIMREGDVLFGKRRAYQKKVAIAPFDGIFSAHGMVLRPKEEVIDKDFFPLFISSDYFLDAAIKISVGSLSPTINWRDLKELEFELPDLDKQRALAKVLWAIDATKKSYQKLLIKSDDLIKSQFLERFGESQNIKKLTDVCSPKQWKTIASKDLLEEGYPVYGANGIIGYTDKYNHVEPTVLITCRGATCGSINVSERYSYINGNAMCLDNLSAELNYKFVEYYLRYFNFSGVITGSAQPQITIEGLRQVNISIPEMVEQENFISFAEQCDKSKSELQQALVELTATYKKIISENLG